MAMSRVATGDIIRQDGRKLDLRDRNMSSEDVAALATVISSSSRLEILSLYNVKLKSDDAVCLARALEFNSTLATLNFTHNPIGEVGTAALAEVIKFNAGLREVSLANTLLNPQGCALLADALIMNRSLARLNLEKNRIGAMGAQYLATALRANQGLRALFLDGNHIGDAGAIAISTALGADVGSRLEMLSLSNTGITEEGAKALGDALEGNLCLKKLVMAKVELLPQVLQGREQGQGEARAASKGLQTVDVSGELLSATLDYPIICRLVKENPCLARLKLARAGLCGVTLGGRGQRSISGLQALSLTLEASPPRLVVLDVSNNFLDDGAAVELASALSRNSILKNLVLHGNRIGAKGIRTMAACLPSSIVELDLSSNPGIREAGGVAIGRFLADFVRSANLRRLDLSKCNLGDVGMQKLAEGLEATKGLVWLGLAGNLNHAGDTGNGKLAIGAVLMTARDLRLQGLYMDLWSVSKGQKELKLVRPMGTVACQLPTTPDVCLFAGVLCSHDWLRTVVLDGNPIDESGCVYLCQALLKNGNVQSLSLCRCGLGDQSGSLVLRLMAEKPGLEVDATAGNHCGEEMSRKLVAALEHARGILSSRVETRRTVVHLLGEAGSGKSTLRESMGRGYFTSLFSTSSENAPDKGVDDVSQRTLGVLSSPLPLGAGGATVLVQDHGGLPRFRGVGALDGGLACPTSVYVVVVSLIADKQNQKRQIKYWLKLIQVISSSDASVLMLVGSRADQMGSIAQDYLEKLWERAREDLTREELRAGLDASLPTFAGCLAADCRKAGDSNVCRLKEAIAHADKLFSEEGAGWLVPPLYPAAALRLERWVEQGSVLVRWSNFVSGVQRQLCPRASEATCVELARSLSREVKMVSKGLSREKERDRGKGWLVLRPSFFLHNVLGGVLGVNMLGFKGVKATVREPGVLSAASVCDAVIGGLESVDPENLVQALLDTDVCAELPSHGEDHTEIMKATPRSDKGGRGWDRPSYASSFASRPEGRKQGGGRGLETKTRSANFVVSSTSTSDAFSALSRYSLSSFYNRHEGDGDIDEGDEDCGEDDDDAGTAADATYPSRPSDRQRLRRRRKDCWAKLERRRLVFPMLLPERETRLGGGKGTGHGEGDDVWMERFARDSEMFVCGRRVACRAPLLTPGLFHMLQARLANSYRGKARLRHGVVELSLDASGLETGKVSGVEPSREEEDAEGVIYAMVEHLEAEFPGEDSVDITAASRDREACFLAVLGLRLVVEQILSQAPNISVEDMAISAESLRQRACPPERLTLPLLQIKQDSEKGHEDCSFGNNNAPELLRDLLWDGPEEFDLDEGGRVISVYSPTHHAPISSASSAAALAISSSTSASAAGSTSSVTSLSNPFGSGVTSTYKTSSKNKNDTGRYNTGTASTADTASISRRFAASASSTQPAPAFVPASVNPFAASPPTKVASASVSASASANPFSSSPPPDEEARTEASPGSPANDRRASLEIDGGGGGDGGYGAGVDTGSGLVAVRQGCSNDGDPLAQSGDKRDPAPIDAVGGVEGGNMDETAARQEEGSNVGIPEAFVFDGSVFRDARRLFGAHLGGRSYHLGKQRAEIVLRRPGGLRLGVWRPPVDEREEREREKDKDKGKAASDKVDQKVDPNIDANDMRTDSKNAPKDPLSVSKSGDGDDYGGVTAEGQDAGDAEGLQEELVEGAADMGAGPTSTPQNEQVFGSSSNSSDHNSGGRRLGRERPAVLEEVLHEDVISEFDYLGSSGYAFGMVGCVVASVSREPFCTTEASLKLPTFEEVTGLLSSKEYPLFVQLCRPPLMFSPEPEYPSVKLLTTLAFTNRNVGKVFGEYRFGDLLEEEGRARWVATTTAVPSDVGDLGTGMLINLSDYHIVGTYLLTQGEAMTLLARFPSRDVFVYVHGFNTPFGYGVRSVAVKGRALRKGLSVCLAWPSNPPGEGAGWLIKQVMSTYERRYTYCEHNMHATIFLFLQAGLDMKAAADSGGKAMCWKGHSMGCYLLLNVVDRLRWKGEDLQPFFRRVILDAPDVPTWFFSSMTKVLAESGVDVCHYFNPEDKAIFASCSRRALQRPVPGHDAIVIHPLVQTVLCEKARSSNGVNHDYGRTDGRCLLDQRDFLAGEPPEQRVLEERFSSKGATCWQLKTW